MRSLNDEFWLLLMIRRQTSIAQSWLMGSAKFMASGLVALLLVFLLGIGAVNGQVDLQATDAEQQARERELADLQARLDRLSAQVDDREAQRRALDAVLRENAQQINAIARIQRGIEKRLDAGAAQVRALEAQLASSSRELERERALLAQTLVASYQAGLDDRLRLLLDRRDLGEIGRVTGYFQLIAAERQQRMERIRDLARQVTEVREVVLDEVARLQRLAEAQADNQAQLESAQAGRVLILRELDANLAQDRARMQALEADAQAMRELLAALRAQAERLAAAIADPAELAIDPVAISNQRGKLDWPLVRQEVISGFRARTQGSSLYADGILLAAQTGDAVRAVHAGRVAYADWLRGFGMLLVIEHEDDMMTLYGHNQSLLVEVGEWVEAGDPVALAGSLGSGESDGVYFALRRQGQPLDPIQWLAPARG